jgi:thymidylate synthase (FAD)
MTQIKVELVDSMGTDISVVNAARVSMGKVKTEFDQDDERLIAYLAKHNHWSPFAHATVTVRAKVPIFVERQIFKHTVGFSYNSISGRYVEFKDEFYIPDTLRQGSPSVKQGSLDQPVKHNHLAIQMISDTYKELFNKYEVLLSAGVCKEQARMVLPLGTMTEFVASGTLYAWARMYNLRSKPDAQKETRDYAGQVGQIMLGLFPVSWKTLTKQEESIK